MRNTDEVVVIVKDASGAQRWASTALRRVGALTVCGALLTLAGCRLRDDAQPASSASPPPKTVRDHEAPIEPKTTPPESSPAWGGLTVHTAGAPLHQAKQALLLLHGYGADADDLREVGLLLSDQTETAIVMPQAPIGLARGGFAWFQMDGGGFYEAVAQLQKLLDYFQREHARLPYALGGFSQGAILTANLLNSTGPDLRALLVFSGADIVGAPPSSAAPRVPVFIAHGQSDRVLSFNQGKKLADEFVAWKYDVTWVPFMGGHTIPEEILVSAKAFLHKAL